MVITGIVLKVGYTIFQYNNKKSKYIMPGLNLLDDDEDLMAHLSQMEHEQNERNSQNVDSFLEFLEKANTLIEAACNFSPLELMDIVGELEESFECINVECCGKIGDIIKIIIANEFQSSQALNYGGTTQQNLALVFRAVDQILSTPPEQAQLDFLFTDNIKKLPRSIIVEYIQQNIDHANFSNEFFQFLKKQASTEHKHTEKHSSRNAMMKERDLTPTFALEELCDTPLDENTVGPCVPSSDDANASSEVNKDENDLIKKQASFRRLMSRGTLLFQENKNNIKSAVTEFTI